ncbi:protein toll isoform X2 [Microplitis demolitor]|nr:protein toll isoform X2 [Microplitis demolitor]
MVWINWCMVLSIISLSWATPECPEGNFCRGCETAPSGDYEINCGTEETSKFSVNYRPNKHLYIKCEGPQNWTYFDLGAVKKVNSVKSVTFKRCTFSDQVNLGTIVKNVFNDTVEELFFRRCKNLTSVLTQESLKEFKKLNSLTLEDNELSNLTTDPFKDLPNLAVMNFRDNDISELPPNFLNVPSIKVIELGYNNLKVIERSTFANLGRLYFLNLWNNQISKIEPHSFDEIQSLESINLHNNKLTAIPPGTFSRLSKLKTINLSHNNFTADSFPADMFRYNDMLVNISMFENRRNITTLPSGFFSNLTSLRKINIRSIGLNNLPEDLIWGSKNLTTFDLRKNHISTIPKNFFRDSQNLISLDISYNKLQNLSDDVFSSLSHLKSLDLSTNYITFLSESLLNGLSSLETLNLANNNMIDVHFKAFHSLTSLRVAQFSNNKLSLSTVKFVDMFGLESPFHHCIQTLEELYLDHNNIKGIYNDWTMAPHLKKLNLSHNDISVLHATQLGFTYKKVDVDLSYNKIKNIFMYRNVFDAIPESYPRDVIIDIGNNPINCDCQIHDLLQYLEGLIPSALNQFELRVKNLKCHEPAELKDYLIKDLSSKSFRCKFDDSQMSNNKSCPSMCDCQLRPSNKAFIVDCSYRKLTEAPEGFYYPAHHVEMNLAGNLLQEFPSLKKPGYSNITILYLNNNNISSIAADNLSDTIEELYLEDNSLSQLDGKVWATLKNSTKLRKLKLHDNSWECNCENRDFFYFIQEKRVKIPELQQVVCSGTETPIFSMTIDEFCPSDLYWIVGICVGIAVLGILIAGLSAWYYHYQHEIKVWLYAHQWCLWVVTEAELDKNKTYDAFISFSHKDEDFIVNELVPKLEQGPKPFKLCVHYRDWLAGEWIPQQIARSVDESRRTIVVLSPNFLESVWGKMEFRAAHNQALSDGRARVIVILYGDIQPSDITDPELKAYLNMNTYVQWGDPWFWDKLRYALPHSKDFIKKNKTVFETHQPTIQVISDKNELIKESPPQSLDKTITDV